MGDPGFWQIGYGSGKGSGGGGLGGNGGNNTVCSNNGYAGISGAPGGPGGAAGKGGRGGGALVIKALNVDITTNNVVFTARGGNGTNGGNGSNGGVGGLGGPGGEGCCPTNAMDAGSGGDGDYGKGGGGGDGGDGGSPGFIWIVCMQNYSYTATTNNLNFNVTGGGAGKGGLGGWGDGNDTYSIIPMDNRCSGDECTSSGTGCLYTCDVDYAMCFLAANATSSNDAGSTDTRFYNGMTEIGRYYDSDHRLEIMDGCDKYVSYWSGTPKSATDMFKHFRSTGTTSQTDVGYLMDYSTYPPSTVGCGSSSYPKHIDFFEPGGEVILSFHHDAIDAAAEINEAESYNSIYADDCHVFAGTQKGSGRDGVAGPNGVYTSQTPNSDNIVIKINVLWKKTSVNSIVKNELIDFNVYPNPSSKNVWIDVESDISDNLIINLFDITGKTVLFKNEIILNGTNKFYLDVSEISSGIYYLNIKSGKRTETVILKVK